MAKRIKKPTVKPEKRLEWLKRVEQGETPPQIAEVDIVDVRTVRKHVDIARMERDVQQARSGVLRDALEGHYRDLLDTVRNIESQVTAESQVSLEKDVPLMYGLHQHISRSPLWENLRKWNRTLLETAELEGVIRDNIQREIEVDGRLGGIISQGSIGVIPAAVDVLVHQVKQWAVSREGLVLDRDIYLEKASDGRVRMRYGFSHFGEIDSGQVEVIKAVISDFETKLKSTPEFLELEKLALRLARLKKSIREATTTILFRRILPGKCKYCPI